MCLHLPGAGVGKLRCLEGARSGDNVTPPGWPRPGLVLELLGCPGGGSALIHKSCGCFLVEPCSSNWEGAGNPSVWRALEPLFERSVIFQSNSLLEPPFIKYS